MNVGVKNSLSQLKMGSVALVRKFDTSVALVECWN